MKIFLVALRRFWLLLLLSGLAGGGLGITAATVFLGPPTPPLWEARTDSILLTQDEAKLLGSRYLRDSSFRAEAQWFFPADSAVGSRATTVGALLVLDSSIQKMAEYLGISSTELEARVGVDETGSPNVLQVTVWGETREQSEQLVAVISSEVENLHTEYFPADSPPRFLGVSFEPPLLSGQLTADELMEWRHDVVLGLGGRQAHFPSALDSIRHEVLAFYSAFNDSESDGIFGIPATAPPVVSISTQSLDRLDSKVQHSSQEGVLSGQKTLVAAFEAAGQLESPFQDTSAVVVLSVGEPYQVLAGPSVDRSVVIIASGALLGLLIAGLFVLRSLSPRRILWSPTQVQEISHSVPIAVLPGAKSVRGASVLHPDSSGVSTLRTNLFFSEKDAHLVALTSPASVSDHVEVAIALAGSLAQIGLRTVVVNGLVPGPQPPSWDFDSGETAAEMDGKGDRPAFLSHPSAQPSGFEVMTLRQEVAGSSNFYLSPDWHEILAWLGRNYEYVLVVLNPVRLGLGAVEAAKRCARAVMVVRPGETRPQDLALAVSQFAQASAPAPDIAVAGVPRDEVEDWYLLDHSKASSPGMSGT